MNKCVNMHGGCRGFSCQISPSVSLSEEIHSHHRLCLWKMEAGKGQNSELLSDKNKGREKKRPKNPQIFVLTSENINTRFNGTFLFNPVKPTMNIDIKFNFWHKEVF